MELMIALVVAGILLTIALPSFQQAQRKGRRADAVDGLLSIQLAQERWRASHANFSTDPAELDIGGSPSGDNCRLTPQAYYELCLGEDPGGASLAVAYEVVATARGAQVGDTACATLRLRVTPTAPRGLRLPAECWP
ncbi:Type IV pilus biogenesis protein PilE [Pseudohaliea rubra DSM 19751]|uniref:Type IV pilus biogenesis protein PilE n=2 Tax=Pseudohaliea TaxID=1341120 RepID=A0A095VRG2_9GAMM|nr:type IV pilin protein [Pseudohaliea rubra]KGE03653.1 Type IV pilus biogenesis protein PilE [Pseudohaliea rubra DSM 19751]